VKKSLLTAASVFSLGALLAACAPGGGSSGSNDDGSAGEGGGSSEQVTLNVWSWRVEDVDEYNEIFAVFEEQNPDIKIEFQAFKDTEYNQILATALSASDSPDVAMVKSYGGIQGNIDSGSLVPIDGVVEGLDDIPQEIQDGVSGVEDGRIYGVPFATQTLQVTYNKGIFDELSLSVPQTWDELLEVSQTIKDADYIPFAVGGADVGSQVPIVAEVFGASRYGGWEFFDAVQSGEKDFTDEDYVASLELLDEILPFLSENVVATTYTDAQSQFLTEQAAMFPGGSWELGFFTSQNEDIEIGTFPVPPNPDWPADEPITPGFVDGGWAIATKSDHQDEAKRLLEWMTTVEFGQLFADKLRQMSPIPGVTFEDPIQQEMADRFAENGGPYMMLVGFRYGQPWGTELLADATQGIWLGKKTAPEAAQDIQTGLEAWFVPNE